MFEIYGSKDCRFCVKAKEILERHHKEYTFIDVMGNDNAFAEFSKKFPNVNRIPQITEGDNHIGGYRELRKWLAMNLAVGP